MIAECVPYTETLLSDVADNGNVPVVAENPILEPDACMYGISVRTNPLIIALAVFNIVTLNALVPKLEGVGVGVTGGVPDAVLVGVVVTVGVLVGVSLVVGVLVGVSLVVGVWVCV